MPFQETSVPTEASAGQERRIALVIGNSAYRHTNELANPINDAKSIAEVLVRLGFEVTSALDLDLRTMGDVQEKFEAELAKKPDVALFFYAGHGLQVKGLNYLVPIDAQIEVSAHLKTRAIRFNDVFEPMTEWAGASLIFLDACRDNPFARNLARNLGENARGAIRGGLARVEKVAGSFIAYATAPDMVAFDGKDSNSPFTSALLKHIETPNLSVSDMMIDVRNAVLAETGGRQEPWDQSSLRARFCFVPRIEATPPPVNPSALSSEQIAKAEELANWNFIRERDNPQELRDHLARFPNGVCSHMAWEKLEALLWHSLREAPTIETLNSFLEEFPESAHGAEAKTRLKDLRKAEAEERTAKEREKMELAAWETVKDTENAEKLASFLQEWPDSPHKAEARRRKKRLEGGLFRKRRTSLVAGGLPLLVAVGFFAFAPATTVSIVPGSARIYSMLGMSVGAEGLAFEGVRYSWTSDGSQTVLEVQGNVRNTGLATLAVPTVIIALRDKNGDVISEWMTEVGATELAVGEEAPFLRQIPSPPSNVRALKVRFADN